MAEEGCHWVCCHVRDNSYSSDYVVEFTNDRGLNLQVFEVIYEVSIRLLCEL